MIKKSKNYWLCQSKSGKAGFKIICADKITAYLISIQNICINDNKTI